MGLSLSICILSQVWYLIVSEPDLSTLTYMDLKLSFVLNDGIMFDEYDTKIFTGNKHGITYA